MSVFALLMKETGCRLNEGFGLRWQDINIENNAVTLTPLKGSYARQMKVVPKLMGFRAFKRTVIPSPLDTEEDGYSFPVEAVVSLRETRIAYGESSHVVFPCRHLGPDRRQCN